METEYKNQQVTQDSPVPANSLPVMEVNVGPQKPEKEIITDEQMINVYSEIIDMIRDDRQEVSEMITDFKNMVLNEGDASTSSKEALINLVKIKADTANNLSRVFDILSRIKIRDRSIPEVVAKQVNKINIGKSAMSLQQNKRKMLESLTKEPKKDN